MLEVLQKILNGEKILLEPNNLTQIYLKLSGVLIEKDKLLEYNNRIYKKIFNKKWIEQSIDKIDRPFSKDLQRWIELNRADSALLKGAEGRIR